MSLNPADNLKNLIDRSIESPQINNLLSGILSNAILGILPGAGNVFTQDTLALFKSQFIDNHLFVEHHLVTATLLAQDDADLKAHKEAIIQLCSDILIYKNAPASTTLSDEKNSEGEFFKDFRRVKCPLNFVKTKLFLDRIESGDLLRIYLDDGAPIENVPRSVRRDGHEIMSREKHEVDGVLYWDLLIKKQ
ncbi:MAG: sulfurtransferase TusA family protein [Fibrobacterales bacterium]